MYAAEDIRKEYERLDRLCGLDTSQIEIVISRRPGRRLGCFRYPLKGDGPLRIIISAALLEQEEQFWDTIRHEYAHAAAYLRHPGEKHGHDKVWKDICRELGCSPERLAPQNQAQQQRTEESAKYRVHCKGCGRDSYFFREGKVIKALRRGGRGRVRCAFCGSDCFELHVRN